MQAGFEMTALYPCVFVLKYSIVDCEQIKTLKEVDSLKDVTVRFGSVTCDGSP